MLQAPVIREITKEDLQALLGDETAARAVDFAGKYGTPVSPHVFETWYSYAERSNKALNDALDYAMNTGQVISKEFLHQLYHEHLSPKAMSDEMNEIGIDLTSTIGNVSEAVDARLKENKAFTGALRVARQSLMQGSSKGEVSDVIKTLHKANQSQIESTSRLSVQLEKNRAQVSKLKSELIEARRQSNTDYVTGLPNRRLLDERLDKAIFECRQRSRDLTVIMGAIDNLDALLETHGATVGDSVVRSFAEQLQRGLKSDQIAARYGGAKFAVVLPGQSLQMAFRIAEEVRKHFRSLEWIARDSGQSIGSLSVSFGGSKLKDGDDRASLLDRVDRFLLEARKTGRDRSIIS